MLGNVLISSVFIVTVNEKDYMVTIPVAENVAWAWMIFFAYIIPELGSWFRSTRMCIFKVRLQKLLVLILIHYDVTNLYMYIYAIFVLF